MALEYVSQIALNDLLGDLIMTCYCVRYYYSQAQHHVDGLV